MKQACIYCSSSANIDPKYFQAAEEITTILVKNNYRIIYGGGSIGLMGKVADTCLQKNGEIIGVIPEFMKEVEWDHPGVKNMVVVDGMYSRKERFFEGTDVIITLPGGCGTLDELLDAVTLKRLNRIKMPIIIFNQDGFFDGIIKQLNDCVDKRFMNEHHRNIWSVIESPDDLLRAIAEAPSFDDYNMEMAHA